MKKLFNKILVPIDFSPVSEKALGKAIEMANEYQCDIHLLHVVTVSPFVFATLSEAHLMYSPELVDNKARLDMELEKMLSRYMPLLCNGRQIFRHIAHGLWNETIIEMVKEHKIDLLLLGQQDHSFLRRKTIIDANSIAETSFIPVITVPGNRRLVELFTILIPVTDFLPVKKLMYGVYMAINHHSTIKLLGIESERDNTYNKKVTHYLKKSFQLIRDNCDVPVEIATAAGGSVAETVNTYANQNSTDLVIINPGRQSRMPGLLSSLLGTMLQRYSIPPVLTISPV